MTCSRRVKKLRRAICHDILNISVRVGRTGAGDFRHLGVKRRRDFRFLTSQPVYHQILDARQDLRGGSAVDAAAVFAEGFIADPVNLVLDFPIPPPPCHQLFCIGSVATDTRDCRVHFAQRLALANSRPHDTTDLLHAGPIEEIVQHVRDRELAKFQASVPFSKHLARLLLRVRFTLLVGGKGLRVCEGQFHISQQCGLVYFDDDEGSSAGIDDLFTDLFLAKHRIIYDDFSLQHKGFQ